MAKKTEQTKTSTKKSGKKKIIFFFILTLIFSILTAAAITWYIYFEKDRFRPKTYTYFDFPPKTQIFFDTNYPQIIELADSIEIQLKTVKKESERILNIEKEYPDQKNITEKAVQKLEKIENDAGNEMEKIINQLNEIYVTANLGSALFDENLKNNSKKAEEKLIIVKEKIISESLPYKSNNINEKGLIGKIKSYLD
ncbi:MAG: hypothetical protein RBR08_10390 [Desulforegulaceae bacterium]|nr:hypothetical protein [Desulforegulaceae bacterium]